jgi:hypothetical protein
MTKIQRKIYEANLALKYFVLNEWNFENDNFLSLSKCLKLGDVQTFGFSDCFHHDILLYIRACIVGIRKYLIFDDERNDEWNRVKYRLMQYLWTFLRFAFYTSISLVLLSKLQEK